MKKKIIIAGGTGFLGQLIAKDFLNKNYDVIILTRRKSETKNNIKYINWDAKNIGNWSQELENADTLINLTGKSVDCRYTEKNKKEIINSRVNATKVLAKAIESLKNPPSLWFNASTATIYEFSYSKPMDEETGDIGNDFSMTVAKKWEKAFFDSPTPKTRKIALRISLVLGKSGGVIPVLKKLVLFHLGGKQGNGKQKFAWLHETDMLRIIGYCIENNNIKGPINCVSTEIIDNKKFMNTFRKNMKICLGIPTPEFMVHIGAFFMRTEPELILKSRYVVPKKLTDLGFQFEYPKIDEALYNILN